MQEATILMDGHVHLYPEYNLQNAFRNGLDNMHRNLNKIENMNGNPVYTVWLLTERWDCTYFSQITKSPEKFAFNGWKVTPSEEEEAVMVEKAGMPKHFIFAGRQLVSNDGLEVLSLATDLFVKDKTLSTPELIEKVNESGGVPVLNWAPGKWFFNRGKIVQKILDTSKTDDFVVGDSPLRFSLWPMPKLMKSAAAKGYKLVAGSDPLPFAGEEKYVGIYSFAMNGEFDPQKPVTSIRKLLRLTDRPAQLIGKRNGVITFFYRETRIMAKK